MRQRSRRCSASLHSASDRDRKSALLWFC